MESQRRIAWTWAIFENIIIKKFTTNENVKILQVMGGGTHTHTHTLSSKTGKEILKADSSKEMIKVMKIKKANKCWQRNLHITLMETKMIQKTLTVWQFLKMLNFRVTTWPSNSTPRYIQEKWKYMFTQKCAHECT